MKKWVYILLLFPVTAMAGESGFGSFLGRLFPRTAENVQSTKEAWTVPADGSHLGTAIMNGFAPMAPPQGYQQNPQAAPQQPMPTYTQPQAAQPAAQHAPSVSAANDQATRENLVRCMRMGGLIEMHTALSEQSVESQDIVTRTKPLYANLKCNDTLSEYSQLIKQVDQAVNPTEQVQR